MYRCEGSASGSAWRYTVVLQRALSTPSEVWCSVAKGAIVQGKVTALCSQRTEPSHIDESGLGTDALTANSRPRVPGSKRVTTANHLWMLPTSTPPSDKSCKAAMRLGTVLVLFSAVQDFKYISTLS
jgi:hypothetical protein